MNAYEARELTQENLKGPVIEPILKEVHEKIEEAAKEGKSSITHPFHGSRGMYPSTNEQEAVWDHLRSEGYKVKHHPNPDPGDPRSNDYDEISWG